MRKIVIFTMILTLIFSTVGCTVHSEPDKKAAESSSTNAIIDTTKLRQLIGAKDKLAQKIDNLDIMDPHYSKKYDDMQSRLDSFYDEIEDVEEAIDTLQERIVNIRSEKITSDNIYQFLQFYGTMYDSFTDAEKKEFMKTFIEKVEIYKEPLSNGQLLKKITFAFPVFYNGEELREISWDEKFTGETIVLLSRA